MPVACGVVKTDLSRKKFLKDFPATSVFKLYSLLFPSPLSGETLTAASFKTGGSFVQWGSRLRPLRPLFA
jgi:hypothetical protein